MSTIGTTIWGSSSRGVIFTAKAPSSREAATISGVSSESMKARAILPATPRPVMDISPWQLSWFDPDPFGHLLHPADDNTLTGGKARYHLNGTFLLLAELYQAQSGYSLPIKHPERRERPSFHHRTFWHQQPGTAGRRESGPAEHP